MSDTMSREEAIAMLKRAIVRCHLSDLPQTKASMSGLLETLDVTDGEQLPRAGERRLLH